MALCVDGKRGVSVMLGRAIDLQVIQPDPRGGQVMTLPNLGKVWLNTGEFIHQLCNVGAGMCMCVVAPEACQQRRTLALPLRHALA